MNRCSVVTFSRVSSHSTDRFRASRKSCRLTHLHPGTTLCNVQHRMVLIDSQFPRDDTGHSSKVGYHKSIEACYTHSNIEKRWDWTRMTLIVSGLFSNLTFLAKVIERMHGESSIDGLPRILQAPSQNPVRVPLLSFNRMMDIFRMESVQCRHRQSRCSSRKCSRASFVPPLHNRHITHHKGVQPQISQYTVCRWRLAVFPRKGLIRGGELFCLYRRNREMDAILHCLPLPASSTTYRASSTLIRCNMHRMRVFVRQTWSFNVSWLSMMTLRSVTVD